jgi:methylglutaconyl-CoA hydratase
MENPFVRYEVSKGVARITFFHPQHNALPSGLLTELRDSILQANVDQDVKVILLASEGSRSFCAGANFDELLAIHDFATGKAFFSGFGGVINAIRRVDKLVIGRIQGKAVGGGVGLAAACDVAFATRNAAVRLSELSIGIGPFVIAPALERKIGKTALAEMTWQPGLWTDADRAHQMGLFARLFDDAAEMDTELAIYLEELRHYSPEAMKALKRVLWSDTGNWDELLDERAALSGQLVLSDFTKKALKRFKEKKK